MARKVIQFNDMLGRPLSIGDAVVFHPGPSHRGKLMAARIERFTSKMVGVSWTDSGRVNRKLTYPDECVAVPMDDYLLHALSRS